MILPESLYNPSLVALVTEFLIDKPEGQKFTIREITDGILIKQKIHKSTYDQNTYRLLYNRVKVATDTAAVSQLVKMETTITDKQWITHVWRS